MRPVPFSLTVKPGAMELLAPLYPELAELPGHRREDDETVRYLRPPDPLPEPDLAYPVRWIVFRSEPAVPGRDSSRSAAPKAFAGLMRECLILPELLDQRVVEQLVGWLRSVEFYELEVDPLPDAVAALKRLVGLD